MYGGKMYKKSPDFYVKETFKILNYIESFKSLKIVSVVLTLKKRVLPNKKLVFSTSN